MGAELFHADGRTDRHDEANNRFSQFCEAPKMMRFRHACHITSAPAYAVLPELPV